MVRGATNIANSCKNRGNGYIIIHLLIIVFGISAWIGINGIFVQLPVLVDHSPEGWALPTYLVIAIQAANIGPIIYALLQHVQYKVNESLCISGVLTVGTIAMALLAFCYNDTVIIADVEYSIPLFILTFFTAFVGCCSSILFMPYLQYFNEVYMVSYFIGEGLSGVLPSIVALIQNIKENTNCAAANNITTKSEVSGLRFLPRDYFIFICIILLLSLMAFIILEYSPFVKNKKNSSKQEDNLQSTIQATQYERNYESASTTNDIYDAGDETTKNYSNKNTFNDINQVEENFSPLSKYYLIILIGILCFFSNGFLPSIQSYSCLPYGNTAYQLSIIFCQFINPIACSLAMWIMPLSLKVINSLSLISLPFCIYVICIALMSPSVPLQKSIHGLILIILTWTILMALISYLKLIIVSVFRRTSKMTNVLFYVGFSMQAGSAIGAIISFILINFTKSFKVYDPCSSQNS